jgi:hypothetical protein
MARGYENFLDYGGSPQHLREQKSSGLSATSQWVATRRTQSEHSKSAPKFMSVVAVMVHETSEAGS